MTQTYDQQVTEFFTSLLGFDPELEVKHHPEEICIHVKLNPQDSGLLIGHHGEVLTALQLLLSLMQHQLADTRKPVRLNINDYREQRQQALASLADSIAQKVLDDGEPLSISNLTSYERRLVHLHLADRTDVITHSEGEPPRRVLVVSPI